MRAVVATAVVAAFLVAVAAAGNENHVFTPCADSKIQRRDGFTFGLAFANRDSFYSNGAQLSPCDSRLSLSSGTAQIAVFRPKVDEISILTINTSNNPSVCSAPLRISLSLPDWLHFSPIYFMFKCLDTNLGFFCDLCWFT